MSANLHFCLPNVNPPLIYEYLIKWCVLVYKVYINIIIYLHTIRQKDDNSCPNGQNAVLHHSGRVAQHFRKRKNESFSRHANQGVTQLSWTTTKRSNPAAHWTNAFKTIQATRTQHNNTDNTRPSPAAIQFTLNTVEQRYADVMPVRRADAVRLLCRFACVRIVNVNNIGERISVFGELMPADLRIAAGWHLFEVHLQQCRTGACVPKFQTEASIICRPQNMLCVALYDVLCARNTLSFGVFVYYQYRGQFRQYCAPTDERSPLD